MDQLMYTPRFPHTLLVQWACPSKNGGGEVESESHILDKLYTKSNCMGLVSSLAVWITYLWFQYLEVQSRDTMLDHSR